MKYTITKRQFKNLFEKFMESRKITYEFYGSGTFINSTTKEPHYVLDLLFLENGKSSYNTKSNFHFKGDKDNLVFIDNSKQLYSIPGFNLFPPNMITGFFVPIIKKYLKNSLEKGYIIPGQKNRLKIDM